MPLFRINHDIHYFAHVPKCAGTSVEAYLKRRFGPLAFLHKSQYSLPERHRWTRTSPQHIDAAALARLFPPDWIASSFALVRHPIARLRSAFDFQLYVQKTIADGTDINDWILSWAATRTAQPFQFDNHLRPAVDFIPQEATVFRLEDGTAPVVAHLDMLAGDQKRPRKIFHRNQSHSGADYLTRQPPLSDHAIEAIATIYAEDFTCFGYRCEDILQDQSAPASGL